MNEDAKKEILMVRESFISYVSVVDNLKNIGNDILEITLGYLNVLQDEYTKEERFSLLKKKLIRCISEISKMKDHPNLKEKYKIIYSQCLVLIISGFESFMSDLFKVIVNNDPAVITWPEKKKISIDPSILKYSSPTIGDLVVKSLRGEINFQDLQSTLRFLKEYLNKDVDIEDIKDDVILAQAFRNAILHNASKIDIDFIKQIRETRYSKLYKEGEEILIDGNLYGKTKDSFLKFCEKIEKTFK